MSLLRARAVIVLVFAVLHVSAGAVAAIGACCAMGSEATHHGGGAATMECCLKGGPNHICPFMSKSRRSKAPGKIDVYCPMGHDSGVPVLGFAAPPLAPVAVAAPRAVPFTVDAFAERAIARIVHPPTPPPRA